MVYVVSAGWRRRSDSRKKKKTDENSENIILIIGWLARARTHTLSDELVFKVDHHHHHGRVIIIIIAVAALVRTHARSHYSDRAFHLLYLRSRAIVKCGYIVCN